MCEAPRRKDGIERCDACNFHTLSQRPGIQSTLPTACFSPWSPSPRSTTSSTAASSQSTAPPFGGWGFASYAVPCACRKALGRRCSAPRKAESILSLSLQASRDTSLSAGCSSTHPSRCSPSRTPSSVPACPRSASPTATTMSSMTRLAQSHHHHHCSRRHCHHPSPSIRAARSGGRLAARPRTRSDSRRSRCMDGDLQVRRLCRMVPS